MAAARRIALSSLKSFHVCFAIDQYEVGFDGVSPEAEARPADGAAAFDMARSPSAVQSHAMTVPQGVYANGCVCAGRRSGSVRMGRSGVGVGEAAREGRRRWRWRCGGEPGGGVDAAEAGGLAVAADRLGGVAVRAAAALV